MPFRSSSILTTKISREWYGGLLAPIVEIGTRKTTGERQMQLESTNQWKSNHSPAGPRLMLVIGLAVLAGLNAGCSSSAQPKAPAPVEVSVAEVVCKQLGDSDEFTGRLEAVNAVEVRPRVSGYLQSV